LNYTRTKIVSLIGSLPVTVDPITPDSQRSMDVDSECSEKK